ncbi:hypothetical protein J1N35_043799 [Gossypium stocksii]|uniref:RNase H type-1 domain-containing protein n=1 Tax=Gossypium stocksii TaxID=47602 RepID=A0A9D3ZFE7_9ROSI|nr:hypothetical protein J1N35_043799 [Gossypium stocksii]
MWNLETPNRIGVPIITEIFEASNSERTLCILLSDSSQEDDVVGQAKSSGEYTVRSGYRLLNTDPMMTIPNADDRTIYKKLWNTPPLLFVQDVKPKLKLFHMDSRTVISNINGAKEDKSLNSAYITDARTQVNHFMKVLFLDANRDCNKVAHAIAQEGFALREDTYLVEEVPTVALTAVVTDRRWVDPPWLTFWLEIVL